MTTTVALVVAGVCLALAIYAFFRQQELATENLEQKEAVTRLERDNKKLQQTLDTQGKKLSKKSGEASKKKSKAEGKQQRLDQQQSQLQKLRAELKESQEKLQTASRDLNRVRIDREETRQKLVAAEERASNAAPASPSASKEASSSPDPAPTQAAQASNEEAAPQPERKPSASKLERDLERAEADRSKAFDRVERYKQALVARESELRNLRRRNEHNRRAYIITQLQLDLANDELYVMQHGEPPPYKQADKQSKRAALRPEQPQEEVLEILNRENPIDLTSAVQDEPAAAPEPQAPEPQAQEPQAAQTEESPEAASAEAKTPQTEAKAPKAKKAKKAKAPKAEAPPVDDLGDDEEGPGAGLSLADLANPDDSEIDKPSQTRRPSARGSLLEQLRGRSVLRKKNPTGTGRVAAPPRPDAPPRPTED